jgi:LmbE family N-acetylglucosaminyl deacetylase
VAEAALYAVFPSAGARPIFPELLEEGLEPWKVNELWMMLSDHSDTVVDVSSAQARKEQALLCHRSQLTEQHIEFVRLFGVEIGARIGAAYGEDFRVMRFYQAVPAASELTP